MRTPVRGASGKKSPEIKPFIRVNPIDKTPSAQNLVISGITSLAPGTPLSWRIQQVTNGTHNDVREFQGVTVSNPRDRGN